MPLRRLYRRMPLLWQLAALCSVLLIVVAALVIALVARTSANRVTASCRFYRDVATLPLDPKSTATGINLVADARIAYQELRCSGRLPAPDPRVAAVLAVRHR